MYKKTLTLQLEHFQSWQDKYRFNNSEIISQVNKKLTIYNVVSVLIKDLEPNTKGFFKEP